MPSPSISAMRFSILKIPLTDRIHQPVILHDLLNERRERCRLIRFLLGSIVDLPAVKVDLDLIPGGDGVTGFFTFQDRQTDVDRIAIEDAGK